MKLNIFFSFLILSLFFTKDSFADEIIQDRNGNFFIMKKDGTFKKLPKPKPGFKYIIKKKTVTKKQKDIFKKPEKKARRRTDTGFR